MRESTENFLRFPCNDRERRICTSLPREELELYADLRNGGATLYEAIAEVCAVAEESD